MIVNCNEWQRPQFSEQAELSTKVRDILSDIRSNGDDAISAYAEKFDGNKPKLIQLKAFDDYELEPELAQAIKLAAERIERFAEFQKQQLQSANFSDEYGEYQQKVQPIDRIGAYIPGGRFPLISTALMTLIPAKVAGSKVRIASSPSDNPALLAAASLAGATEFRLLGGIQAIGAFAYGYADQSAVDLIVGPGNAWVNEAKNQCQGIVKIDGLAGPSELLALCDSNQPVDWLAYDALAQAEHDPNACSLIVSDDLNWLQKLESYLGQSTEGSALVENNQIALIQAQSVNEMIKFSEHYAPEHLMLCHDEISEASLSNYGSLFVGANSAVALGDYISGPNHTLPTLGFAKQTGGLSVNNFMRIMTTQKLNDLGRETLSKTAMPLAEAEGLVQHYNSMKVRT